VSAGWDYFSNYIVGGRLGLGVREIGGGKALDGATMLERRGEFERWEGEL
jgi:hypothetical protein